MKLTKREKQVLIEILKEGRITDQAIARKLKTSRPSILKIRRRLESKGIIKGYNAMVNFEKLGFTLQAAILYSWRNYSKSRELESTIKFIKSSPEVILFVKGEGAGDKTDMIISLHEDLKDYEKFIRKLKYQWRDNVENVSVFLSSIDGIFKYYELSSPVNAKINQKIIYSE